MAHKNLPIGNSSRSSESKEDLVAELAWKYCQKTRKGGQSSIAQYLRRLPDESSRREFLLLVSMDTLVDTALDFKHHSSQSDRPDGFDCDMPFQTRVDSTLRRG